MRCLRFANGNGGHKALIKWLAQTPVQRVAFEPTGPYHRALERTLGAAGVPFAKVNPRQARRSRRYPKMKTPTDWPGLFFLTH
ncbi:transposase [Rhodoblastus sphagnicola]|nr:transposase [Rhodoblastus sphagnicola]